ncbi:MAG: SDR family oxidoreductase [Deltaproteobacteria bacterium]|nr:SDR family oxidoreductase [Deltaproteobacteria bacterium]
MSVVVVTGASGLLGTNLCFALRDAGHEVRALYRSEPTIAHIKSDPRGAAIAWFKGDLDDAAALERAFSGADVVFHVAALVSILPTVTPAMVRANVDGTRNVLNAVRNAKVKRLVHTSSTVAVGLAAAGGPDVGEEQSWNLREAGLADGYSITKRESEELVMKAAKEDVDAVVVNPGYMFGPYDSKPSSGKLILDVAKGKVPGSTPGVNSFVDVRDVARGMIAAWERGIRGERYILAGHNLTYKDILKRIATCAGVRAPSLAIPFAAAMLIGRAGDLMASITGKEPLLTSAAVRWAFNDRFRPSSSKAERVLGYRISPIEPAINDALAWFRATGKL